MKIAVCFFGLVGNKKGKYIPHGSVEDRNEILEYCYSSVKEHIINQNNVDVFFHTWDRGFEKELVKKYNPKSYKVQKQKIFTDTVKGPYDRIQAHYSRWYSAKESNKLKSKYEKENNFKYDFVLSTRFDMVWSKNVIFGEFDKDIFYIPGVFRGSDIWGWPNSISDSSIADHWFFSGSENMDKMHTLYDKINQYIIKENCDTGPTGISNHMLALHHLKKLGLVPNKTKRVFHMLKGTSTKTRVPQNDFQIYRSFTD